MILFYTRSGSGFGIGHLKRCIRLAEILADKGMKPLLAVRTDEPPEKLAVMTNGFEWRRFTEKGTDELSRLMKTYPFEVVVADARELDGDTFAALRDSGLPVLSFDDYGAGNHIYEASFCPLPYHRTKNANIEGMEFTPLDPAIDNLRSVNTTEKGTVVVSFGGSDPAGIALCVVSALTDGNNRIIVIEGPLCRYAWAGKFANLELIRNPDRIAPYLAKAETVLTTVGMTLVESLALGKKVVAIHPTRYHARIGKTVRGVTDLGYFKRATPKRIQAAADAEVPPNGTVFPSTGEYASRWTEIVSTAAAQGKAACPVCGSVERTAIRRGEGMTLFRCMSCRSNYPFRLKPLTDVYSETYFEERYKAAYGKTLAEDEANVRAMARRRLAVIAEYAAPARILDIGAGTGIFLDEAKKFMENNADRFDAGNGRLAMTHAALGVEVSEAARKTVKERFGIEMKRDMDEIAGEFDAVTFWFSLEHVRDPGKWLTGAAKLMRPGGVLAIGVPNGYGAFAGFNPAGYFDKRPVEHEFEPSMKGMKRLLARHGFRVLRVEYFGLHPDRIGLPDNRLTRAIQKTFKLGDTFEIYAEKLPETH